MASAASAANGEVSELVSNSLVHGGLGAEDNIVVTVDLDVDTLRFEVRNPGVAGEIASHGGDRERGRGFGLELVTLLGSDWGVRRECVWVEMHRAA
jgi:two-component sensor histidine kinase